MKIINNIIIVCMLTALPAYSASASYESDQSVESVFRVRHISEVEDFQTKLRHVLKQMSEIQIRLKGLTRDANCFAHSNPENAVLIGNMRLTLDQRFVDSMGEEFRKVNVDQYRDRLTEGVSLLRGCCSQFLCSIKKYLVRDLILVGEFLNVIDLTEGVCSVQDRFSLTDRDKAMCAHPAQDPLEILLAGTKDINYLLEEHLRSIDACTISACGIVQGEVCDPFRSDLSRLCDKSVLDQMLQNYRILLVEALKKNMYKCSDLFTKCLDQERSFRSSGNPLVVLQEECSHLTLEERRADLRDNLDEFMKMECEISNRLERLAGCATFFIHYDFEKDVRRFPQLGVAHADWYENVLKKQVTEFINAESLLRRRAMGKCFVDILRVLHERDDIVLPPIKVECDFKENDLCGNVEVCIRILQEVQDLEKRQSRQKESLQRSVFGVVCDQTAEATLEYQYIRKLKESLLGPLVVSDQNERREMVGKQLFVFLDFLKVKGYMIEPEPSRMMSFLGNLLSWS